MSWCSLPFRVLVDALSIRRHTRTLEKDVITEARGWSDTLVLVDFDDSIYDALGAAGSIRSPRLLCHDISLLSVFTHDRVLYSPFKFQVEAYFLFLPVRANCVCFHLCKSNSHFDLNIYHIDYNFLKFLNFSLIIMDSWTLTLFEFSICHSICIEIIFEINLFIRDINIFPLVEISFVSTRIKNRISERIFLSIANRLVAY